tara:strand:+ start:815 stop:1630 length:816 start_codon:yes stop_codon:yes gene_type:complete
MKPLIIKRPLVSVVMPTYNYAHFIGDAIRSVLNQTYENLELIIIDNYSEDNTEDVIGSFGESRIKYKKFSNNGIIAASRNVGIRESRGKYIAFLDSDDMWESTKIEKQIEIIENNDNVFLVYTRYIIMRNGTFLRIQPKREKMKSGKAFIPLFLSNNFIGTSTVLLRNILEEDGFLFDEDTKLRCSEDFALWLKIAKDNHIAFVDEPLVTYREHGGNTSIGILFFLFRYLQVVKRFRHDVSKTLLIGKYLLIFATIGSLIIKKVLAKKYII